MSKVDRSVLDTQGVNLWIVRKSANPSEVRWVQRAEIGALETDP